MELTSLSREHQEFSRKMVIATIAMVVVFYLGWRMAEAHFVSAIAHHVTSSIDNHNHGANQSVHAEVIHPAPPAFYAIIPFGILLFSIALLPLFRKTEHWWENNYNRLLVASSLGLVTLVYYAFIYGHGVVDHSTHTLSGTGIAAAITVLKNAVLVEYIPFIALLFSLYVISGGIAFEGHLVGKPTLNCGIIGIGGLLASFIGTTGAAMLLIRPLLKANVKRNKVSHTVIFFIFVVCNTGGCLLPIGDPPLYLGFLRGVNFAWTLSLWPMWLFMNICLIAIYFVWDKINYRKENHEEVEEKPLTHEPYAIRGCINFLWLAGVIGCVICLDPSKPFPGTHWYAPAFFREIMMLGITALSLYTTSSEIRRKNAFNYDAILEVAALFIGIFICMQIPVQILNTYGPSLGVDSPMKFYWGTGILSSFLDNAPTYVVFFETAKTMDGEGLRVAGVLVAQLTAISLGAVFMGAMTYIGNGPNFMVKAIAESNNVKMPSFFGYMLYSCVVLLPLSLVMAYIFL
jgi:Na+/H+ antiporter NhaD/arsenite permease-like protein